MTFLKIHRKAVSAVTIIALFSVTGTSYAGYDDDRTFFQPQQNRNLDVLRYNQQNSFIDFSNFSPSYTGFMAVRARKTKELGYVDGKDIPYTARMRKK